MQEKLNCVTCGFANSFDHRFCRRCGTLLEDYSDEPEQKLELVNAKVATTPFSFMQLMITIAIIGILVAMAIPNTSRGRPRSRFKSCMANTRVLMGAIEMYNMDNNEMMHEFDTAAMQKLVDGKYLKYLVKCPSDPPGDYRVIGDLAHDGEIACSVHGTPDNPMNLDN